MENEVQLPNTFWCRKCMKFLPEKDFYKAVDNGLVDTNLKLSVCKTCAQKIYDTIFAELGSLEKTIHKMCVVLNIKFTNQALDATKAHINTLLGNGKNVNAIFSIYLMKLVATNPSMDKSISQYNGYEDVGAIFTDKETNLTETPIPQSVIDFWGSDISRRDIEFLEREYANFKSTHKADTYAEIVLLKQVCYTMLDIKNMRVNNDDTTDLVKELQALMKNLAISPNVKNVVDATNKGDDSFGLWIQDIEREEPAQWLKTDNRFDMYKDVGNVEEYFQKYMVRPLKNFILSSKDFNIGDTDREEDFFNAEDDDTKLNLIDDGEVDKE